MSAVFWKELADHFGRRRFLLTLSLLVLGLVWGTFVVVREVEPSVLSISDFVFLAVFTANSGVLPSLLFFLSFFGPIIGITLGFDAINSERTSGTLSRVLAQPVFRDAVFNGKLLAGMLTLFVLVASLMVCMVGIAMYRLGMAPGTDELVRLVGFTLVTTVYLAFWLALAMTASVLLRNTVASALVSIAAWLVAGFLIAVTASAIADIAVPTVETSEQALAHYEVSSWIGRLSPSQLYTEATGILLDPIGGRAVTPLQLAPERLDYLLATPVPAGQSLQLVWPHIVVLLALASVLVGGAYVRFMREEIRS
ncbi:MAG: ABC transporter permease [Chloroflexota bacterium]